MWGPGRIALVVLAAVAAALACAAAAAPGPRAAQADPPDVVLVTGDCDSGSLVCGPFVRAAKRTGAQARIVSPDPREDIVGTLSLLARQRHDLVVTDIFLSRELAEVAPKFPRTHFALFDGPLVIVDGTPSNVAAVLIRPNEAAYLAGWLAARLERSRPGPDIVGVVGGEPIPPVQDFVLGFRAGAKAASPRVTVLTGYSLDFTDPTKCATVARRQIAQGAGTVFDVAGGCGPGTLRGGEGRGGVGHRRGRGPRRARPPHPDQRGEALRPRDGDPDARREVGAPRLRPDDDHRPAGRRRGAGAHQPPRPGRGAGGARRGAGARRRGEGPRPRDHDPGSVAVTSPS